MTRHKKSKYAVADTTTTRKGRGRRAPDGGKLGLELLELLPEPRALVVQRRHFCLPLPIQKVPLLLAGASHLEQLLLCPRIRPHQTRMLPQDPNLGYR